MFQIIILSIIIGLIDTSNILSTNNFKKIRQISSINLLYLYSVWLTLAILIYFFIINRQNYSLLTILFNGPLLGFGIYWIFNILYIMLNPSIKLSLGIYNTLWGMILITSSTLIHKLIF